MPAIIVSACDYAQANQALAKYVELHGHKTIHTYVVHGFTAYGRFNGKQVKDVIQIKNNRCLLTPITQAIIEVLAVAIAHIHRYPEIYSYAPIDHALIEKSIFEACWKEEVKVES